MISPCVRAGRNSVCVLVVVVVVIVIIVLLGISVESVCLSRRIDSDLHGKGLITDKRKKEDRRK